MSQVDNSTLVPECQVNDDQANKYRARTIRDITERPTPPPIPIIADGILTFDSQACIVGSSKVGKSLFTIQLGLRTAQGGNCLGLEILRPCKVLYLNFEIHESIMEERVKQVRGRIAVSDVSNFRHLTLLGDDIPQVNTDEGKQKLIDIIQANTDNDFKPDVLILDNRWKITLGDPNQEANIKPLCLNLEEIRKAFAPMVIIVVHHHGKGTVGVGAGSSSWDRWVNTAFDMIPHHFAEPLPSPIKYHRAVPPSHYMVNIGLVLKESPLPKKKASGSLVNLNALPQVYMPKSRSLAQIIFIPGVIIAVSLLAYPIMLVQSAAADTASLQTQLDITNKRYNQTQAQKKAITELKGKVDSIESAGETYTQALERFEQHHEIVNNDLPTAISGLSSSLALINMAHTTSQLVISGVASDETVILGYAEKLRDSERFAQVIVTSIEKAAEERYNFTLTLAK